MSVHIAPNGQSLPNKLGVHVDVADRKSGCYYIVRLSLLTMTNINHMPEMLLFVCSKMSD